MIDITHSCSPPPPPEQGINFCPQYPIRTLPFHSHSSGPPPPTESRGHNRSSLSHSTCTPHFPICSPELFPNFPAVRFPFCTTSMSVRYRTLHYLRRTMLLRLCCATSHAGKGQKNSNWKKIESKKLNSPRSQCHPLPTLPSPLQSGVVCVILMIVPHPAWHPRSPVGPRLPFAATRLAAKNNRLRSHLTTYFVLLHLV